MAGHGYLVFVDLGLEGRAAIVTGAGRGIGRQVALTLAGEGCRVLLVARGAEALSSVAEAIGQRGGTATPLAVDVTGAGTPNEIVERCLDAYGRLDILVNNAGASEPKALETLTSDDWRSAMELNFLAAARLSVACAPVMRAAGWGRMVHVASTSGRRPDKLFAPYSAAKAALINLSASLAAELSAHGVLSNCIVAGVTLTEMVQLNADATAARTDTTVGDVMARMLARTAPVAGRFGIPEEIAAAVVFLASEPASWITGATLEVDGGTLRVG